VVRPDEPELKVTWKITALTAENDSDGSRRQRQLQAIVRLVRRATEASGRGDDGGTTEPRPGKAHTTRDALRCSRMATDVPQRELRNNTAGLLRRVEAGERLRITVHGHPVAELVPVERAQQFARFDEVLRGLRGLMRSDDRLEDELRELDQPPRNPFA
jgi:prevent-host-death family protein